MTCRLYAVCLSLVVMTGCGPTPAGNSGTNGEPEVTEAMTEGGDSGEHDSYFERTRRKATEQGDADAQYSLGALYYAGKDITGKDVPKDYTEAVKWWLKAAEQGHARAQHQVGLRYDRGEGVSEDKAEAAKWFRKAAEQGGMSAQYKLGVMYRDGLGVPKDDVEACVWFSVAATTGHRSAKKSLAKAKAQLNPEQLAAAEKRAAELTEQINASKAKLPPVHKRELHSRRFSGDREPEISAVVGNVAVTASAVGCVQVSDVMACMPAVLVAVR